MTFSTSPHSCTPWIFWHSVGRRSNLCPLTSEVGGDVQSDDAIYNCTTFCPWTPKIFWRSVGRRSNLCPSTLVLTGYLDFRRSVGRCSTDITLCPLMSEILWRSEEQRITTCPLTPESSWRSAGRCSLSPGLSVSTDFGDLLAFSWMML